MVFYYINSEYEVECACSRNQCPVRKSARRLRKHSSGGSGDQNGLPNGRTVQASKQTVVKKLVHEKLRVEIPVSHGDGDKEVVSCNVIGLLAQRCPLSFGTDDSMSKQHFVWTIVIKRVTEWHISCGRQFYTCTGKLSTV